MMPDDYLVYNIRSGGWLTETGQLTSSVKDAATFSEADAIEACTKDHDGNYTSIPVSNNTLARVKRA